MKVTLTLTVQVEVEMAAHEREAAVAEVLHEADKALDYWFSHTDRSMTNRGVTVQGEQA